MLLSIIIPSTGPRSELLQQTIGSAIKAIDGAGDMEIVAVVGKEKEVNTTDARIKFLRVDYNNVSRARNEGAANARGEFLLFIDDDILIKAGNLKRFFSVNETLLPRFIYNCVWVHSPEVDQIKSNTKIGRCIAWLLPFDSFEKRYVNFLKLTDWEQASVFQSRQAEEFSEAAFFISRANFNLLKGFNNDFNFGGEGAELLRRARENGFEYYIDSANIVWHNERDKYAGWDFTFKKQAFTAGQVNRGEKGAPQLEDGLNKKRIYGEQLAKFEKLFEAIIKYGPNSKALHPVYRRIFSRLVQIKFWKEIDWKVIDKGIKK